MAQHIKQRGTKRLTLFPVKDSGRGTAADFRLALYEELGIRTREFYSTQRRFLQDQNAAAIAAGYTIVEVDPADYEPRAIRDSINRELYAEQAA